MPDKVVDVQINLQAGQDGLTPQLKAMGATADDLAKAIEKVREQLKQQALQAQAQDILGVKGGGGAGGITEQLRAMGIAGPISAMTRSLGDMRATVQGIVGGLSGMPGPLGIVASTAQGIAGLFNFITEQLKVWPISLAEVNQRLQEGQNILRTVRAEGAPRQETFRAAFQGMPEVVQQMRAAQEAGNLQRQLQIVRLEQARAQRDVEREEETDPLTRSTQLERLLRDRQANLRAGGARRTEEVERTPAYLAELVRLVPGQATPEFLDVNMSEERIRALSNIPLANLANAQARLAVTSAARREGIVPSLRPGAPGLADLPAFQTRAGNVLDLHAQVQADALRDERAEARFQAEQILRQQILDELRNIGAQVGPAQPEVGPYHA